MGAVSNNRLFSQSLVVLSEAKNPVDSWSHCFAGTPQNGINKQHRDKILFETSGHVKISLSSICKKGKW